MRKVHAALISMNYCSTELKDESRVGPCYTDTPPSLPFAESQEIYNVNAKKQPVACIHLMET